MDKAVQGRGNERDVTGNTADWPGRAATGFTSRRYLVARILPAALSGRTEHDCVTFGTTSWLSVQFCLNFTLIYYDKKVYYEFLLIVKKKVMGTIRTRCLFFSGCSYYCAVPGGQKRGQQGAQGLCAGTGTGRAGGGGEVGIQPLTSA